MIGVGISAGLSGSKRARTIQDPLPALDLDWATNRSLPAAYGPTPSFSRASVGTYFNSSGVLTSAAVNVPRFNHVYSGGSWVSKGLLIEEQRTNLITYSEDLNSNNWTLARGTASANQTTAPDGTLTADRFTESTATGVHGWVQFNLATTSGASFTASVFLKAAERSVFVVRFQDNATGAHGAGAEFDLSTGTVSVSALNAGGFTGASAAIEFAGNGWYRCSVSSVVNTTSCSLRVEGCTGTGKFSSGSFNGESYTGDSSKGWFVWGQQFEAGFKTSYAPSLTASATRSADVCQLAGSAFSSVWNPLEGTIVVEGDCQATGTRPFLSFDDSTANERIEIYGSGTDPKVLVVDGGSTQVDIDAGTISSGTAFKLAFAYKANDFAVSLNGGTVATDTVGTLPTVDRLRIGANQAGDYLNGHISRLRYYPTRLTNAQLQSLST